ncbi:hypothetical protein [Aquimarina megaterium]|uniref:hypothetical protein n=1 Tax=Aquimarina megaterium TaxID=1443666 RepID=UPI000472D0AA|nr:hypothetical protein [Aquimarina megaterium]
MSKIGLDTYKLYCKYGIAQWEEDRTGKPKDVPENIGKDFETIATISNNLYMIKSGFYSSKLEEEMKKEILELKIKITDKVYEYIERDEKIFPERKLNFLQRILNKI